MCVRRARCIARDGLGRRARRRRGRARKRQPPARETDERRRAAPATLRRRRRRRFKRRDWNYMHKRDGESESESESDSVESAGGRASSSSSESGASEEADARVSSSESSEEDGEEDGKAMRKRYDEARGAIERALRGEGDSKNVAAKCRACPGTLLLNAGDMREHAKSKKHAKNLKRLGKADDDTFVCFYPAVKEDEGIVSDGEAETHAERLARLRAQKILRAAEGERTEGGKFSLDQFDSSDDEDGDGDSDDADDDARDAKMTKRLAKKKFLRKVKESTVSNDEGSKEKRSRRHAQRKRKGKSKPGKRQRMLMRAASNDA